MPIYEYHCSDCNKDVDVFFLSFSEAQGEEATCPECGGTSLTRLISSVAVVKDKPARSKSTSKSANKKGEDTKSLADTMNKAERSSKGGYGDDFKEVAGRLEKGESSTSIEKRMRDRVGEKMGIH